MTGMTRRISSSPRPRAAPGRVDLPPTSTISAPSACSVQAMRDRNPGLDEPAAVRKAVRRDVDHAHDQGPAVRQTRRPAGRGEQAIPRRWPRAHGRPAAVPARREVARRRPRLGDAGAARDQISQAANAAVPPASGDAQPASTASRAASPPISPAAGGRPLPLGGTRRAPPRRAGRFEARIGADRVKRPVAGSAPCRRRRPWAARRRRHRAAAAAARGRGARGEASCGDALGIGSPRSTALTSSPVRVSCSSNAFARSCSRSRLSR